MRLTEELPMGSYRAKTYYLEPNRNEQECIYKLGQLEDIEEKHNIESLDDLDNRLKALAIIKEKPLTLFLVQTCENYDIYLEIAQDTTLVEDIYSPKEFYLLKEVLL